MAKNNNNNQNNSHETINLIGKWVCLVACVGAAIYFAAIGKQEYAYGFGVGAFWAYWILF